MKKKKLFENVNYNRNFGFGELLMHTHTIQQNKKKHLHSHARHCVARICLVHTKDNQYCYKCSIKKI